MMAVITTVGTDKAGRVYPMKYAALADSLMVRKLVRTVSQNYRLPYFTISPVFSICPVHGYIAGNRPVCPYEHTEEDLDRYGVIPSHKELSDATEESRTM